MKLIKNKLSSDELSTILSDKDFEQKDNYLQINGINHFKFKAGYELNLTSLFEKQGNRCLVILIPMLPDTGFDLYTAMSFDELQDEKGIMPDENVKLQTIEIKEDYTGKRNYKLA